MNFQDPDEMEVLAGEYVLGVLSVEEKNAFEKEMQHNRALTRAVGEWNDRLLAVAPVPSAVQPDSTLWARIERDLPGNKSARSKTRTIWNNLSIWRASSFVGLAASLFLALRLFTIDPETNGPNYLAVLQAPDKAATWIVEVEDKTVRLRPLMPMTVSTGKAIEFWTKPEGAAAPTSLGLVPPDRSIEIPADKLPGIGPNQLFEVTLEPENGSPTGRPTGPILAVGKAVRL